MYLYIYIYSYFYIIIDNHIYILKIILLVLPKIILLYYTYIFTEEVIWRKLLIDGDGIGDDRRLNILLKSYLKWCNTKYSDPIERCNIIY